MRINKLKEELMQKFVNKWSWSNIIITLLVVITLGITLYFSYFVKARFIFWIMLAICLPTFIAPLFCCPISAEKEGNNLWINFLLRRKHIDLTDCQVEKVRRIGMFEYLRTLGASSYFGDWGYFSKEGTPYLFFLTHSRENVCLISSPKNPRKLMINAPYEWFKQETKET